jgi:hypothetical protein
MDCRLLLPSLAHVGGDMHIQGNEGLNCDSFEECASNGVVVGSYSCEGKKSSSPAARQHPSQTNPANSTQTPTSLIFAIYFERVACHDISSNQSGYRDRCISGCDHPCRVDSVGLGPKETASESFDRSSRHILEGSTSTLSPGNSTLSPGNSTLSPGNSTLSPGNSTLSPGPVELRRNILGHIDHLWGYCVSRLSMGRPWTQWALAKHSVHKLGDPFHHSHIIRNSHVSFSSSRRLR